MIIIPAIDLLQGAVVRLQQGRYDSAYTYPCTALEAARRIADAGLHRLHLVDLSGARTGVSDVASTVSAIVRATDLHIDVGGGIRSVQTARDMVDAGARSICLGSVAIESPDTVDAIADAVGIDAVIIALDARDGIVRTRGWEHDGGCSLADAVSAHGKRGYRRIMVTDIARDGMMQGPSLATYRALRASEPSVELIASGGIRSAEDCAALSAIGCAGAVIGKAWLDGSLDLRHVGSVSC
jgi:phosphoribosylformimino-5-aminoimidazole carboxamide ribotide isomerase